MCSDKCFFLFLQAVFTINERIFLFSDGADPHGRPSQCAKEALNLSFWPLGGLGFRSVLFWQVWKICFFQRKTGGGGSGTGMLSCLPEVGRFLAFLGRRHFSVVWGWGCNTRQHTEPAPCLSRHVKGRLRLHRPEPSPPAPGTRPHPFNPLRRSWVTPADSGLFQVGFKWFFSRKWGSDLTQPQAV